MSIFLILSGICLELERSMQNFFWGGSSGGKITHLARWKIITNSPSEGGLDIGGLMNRNLASIVKWDWHSFNEPILYERR